MPIVKRDAGVMSRLLRLVACGALLTGCAGTPPAEVCSAAWIKPRVDSALSEFRAVADEAYVGLRRQGDRVARKGSLGLIERAAAMLALTRLVAQFQNSQALDDIQTLGRTCNDPELARKALRSTLVEYDVPESLLDLLDEVEAFTELITESRG